MSLIFSPPFIPLSFSYDVDIRIEFDAALVKIDFFFIDDVEFNNGCYYEIC